MFISYTSNLNTYTDEKCVNLGNLSRSLAGRAAYDLEESLFPGQGIHFSCPSNKRI